MKPSRSRGRSSRLPPLFCGVITHGLGVDSPKCQRLRLSLFTSPTSKSQRPPLSLELRQATRPAYITASLLLQRYEPNRSCDGGRCIAKTKRLVRPPPDRGMEIISECHQRPLRAGARRGPCEGLPGLFCFARTMRVSH